MKFQLSLADRERLGAPEWIEIGGSLSVRDAAALEAAGGDWTGWGRFTANSLLLALWLTLHKAGNAPPLDELDFDLSAAKFESPGKAPSATKSARTRSTSADSSPSSTSRRKR